MASNAPMMPAHIYEGTDFRTNPYNLKPIGTGPFKFAEWKRGQYIHLARNEHYWKPGQPGMDGIYYRLCPTPEQRMVAMETGAVDIAMADDIDTVVASRLMANPDIVTRTDAYNGTAEITVMELNQRRWPFSDRRFRAAFLHAVDREFLVKAINFGQGKVATGPIPSTAPYYDRQGADAISLRSGARPSPAGRDGIEAQAGRGAPPFRHHADARWRRRLDPRRAIYQAGAGRGRAGGGTGSDRLAHPAAPQRQLGIRLRQQFLWRIWRSRHRHLALLSVRPTSARACR